MTEKEILEKCMLSEGEDSMYTKISAYFDKIFPLNVETVEFLDEVFKSSERVLDVACGDGKYTNALVTNGRKVIGVDVDEQMIEVATEKYPELLFDIASFETLHQYVPRSSMDGIFCIGNSIAHVQSIEELESLFTCFSLLLKPSGKLVIQSINFDRIFARQVKSLPMIANDAVLFDRVYDYTTGPKIEFKTKLIVDENVIQESIQELYGIAREQVLQAAQKAGLELVNVYGGYGKEEWTLDSFQSVFVFEKL